MFKHGFADSLNFPDLHSLTKKKLFKKSGNQYRNINLTKSGYDLTLYGRRVKSILHVWVTEARHFGRYSCRMQTRHGLSEGFIRLRNQGQLIIQMCL